jgi:hypothetical protein
VHGESGSVDTTTIAKQRQDLAALIDQYEPRDTYNIDETGLLYRILPSKSLSTKSIRGKKKDKERVTVTLCCNLDGSEKLPLVIIGKSKNPPCFKGFKIVQLEVKYFSNESAWMTNEVFTAWLKYFNLQMCGQNVLLLVNNTPTHKTLELNNVRVKFLPPNATSMLQPLDAGIIQDFKLIYKRLFLQWYIDKVECCHRKKIDLLSAIHFMIEAWGNTSDRTIRNCWIGTGIVPAPKAAILKSSNEPKKKPKFDELASLISKLSLCDAMGAEEFVNEDFDDVAIR